MRPIIADTNKKSLLNRMLKLGIEKEDKGAVKKIIDSLKPIGKVYELKLDHPQLIELGY